MSLPRQLYSIYHFNDQRAMDKERIVLEILTRYGLYDRKVVVSNRGVTVFLPMGCRNDENEDLFDDIADALHDRQGVVIMNVQQGMSAEEFVRQNKGRLEIMGLI